MGGGGSDPPKLLQAGLQHALVAWDALQHHLSGSTAPLPPPGFEDATWSAALPCWPPGAPAVRSRTNLSSHCDGLRSACPHSLRLPAAGPPAAHRCRCPPVSLLPQPPVCVVAQDQPAWRGCPAAGLHRHVGAAAATHCRARLRADQVRC